MLSLIYMYLMILFSMCTGNVIYELKGFKVEFVCPYLFFAGDRNYVRWYFFQPDLGSVVTYTYNNETSPSLDNDLKDRLSILINHTIGEYNLRITDIRESDEGTYSCSDLTHQHFIKLKVIEAPSSVIIDNETEDNRLIATEGTDFNVSCSAVGGKPPPNVTITIDGSVVAFNNQSVQHVIPTVSRLFDLKTVLCTASSVATVQNPLTNSSSIYLNLKPLKPTLEPEQVSTSVTNPLIASCSSAGSRPLAVLKWTISQTDVTESAVSNGIHNITDDTYTVKSTLTYNVDRNHNNQIITCTAVNLAMPNGIQTNTTIDVKYAPDVTVTNATYTSNDVNRSVRCIPNGNPATYTFYRWQHRSKYGQVVRHLDGEPDGELVLPDTPKSDRYQDSGEYVCTVSNGIANTKGDMKQLGYGYIVINDRPIFTRDNSDIAYGRFHEDFALNVFVYSIPVFGTPSWYKDGTLVAPSTKYTMSKKASVVNAAFHGTDIRLDGFMLTLTIKNLKDCDIDANYTLELSNEAGDPATYSIYVASLAEDRQIKISEELFGSIVGSLVCLVIILMVILLLVLIKYQALPCLFCKTSKNQRARNDDISVRYKAETDCYEEVDNDKHMKSIKENDRPETSTKHYETLGEQNKPNVYDIIGQEQETSESAYNNV